MTASQSNASLFSRIIAFGLPLILAAYWPFFATGYAVHAGVVLIRLILLAAVAMLCMLWVGGASSPMELRWTGLLAAYLCVLFIASLLGAEVSRGMHNWLRVLPVYCIAVALARPLRHKGTGKAFGIALGLAGLLSLSFIVAIYLYYAGFSVPTYSQLRDFKGQVQQASGVALNPLASATLLFCALSLCLRRSGWAQRAILVAVAVLASALTGSRAPVALALAAACALSITISLRSRALVLRAVAGSALLLLLVAGILGLLLVRPTKLSAVTEGRYDLWSVGIEKFLERPWIGNGAESWRDDLDSRLPGYYAGAEGRSIELHAGGYHSEFVTLLAEGGLLCFIPAMLIFGFLLQSCCRIAFHPATSKSTGQAILFTFFLIFFRACVETPGMFGYGEDVTDYLAAMFLAIVLSRASLLEKPGIVELPRGADERAQGHAPFPRTVAPA